MKKTLGVLVIAICFLVAGVLNATGFFSLKDNSAIKSSAESGYFSGMHNQFKLVENNVGIFILKEESVYKDVNDSFNGSVVLTAGSGVDESGRSYTNYTNIDWKYEAIVADSSGFWRATDILQISVHPSRKSVQYWLPRAAVAGDYGIRVTAYIGGQVLVDGQRQVVSGIYVIKYAEEMSYMYCADNYGNTTYNVFERGNGLGRSIYVNVLVNPGAVRIGELDIHEVYDSQSGEKFNVGNLELNAGLSMSSLNMHFENALGEEFMEGLIVPTVEKVNGLIRVDLPADLPIGNYVLRVYHNITDNVFGTFVIQNGGVFAEPGAGLEAMAPVLFVGGAICLGIFGFMFLIPAVAVSIQQVQYQAMEQKRFKQAKKGELMEDWYDSSGKKLTPEEVEKLTDEEREALLKQRAVKAKESRSGKFLGKMAENRQKREVAREAGLTMEEFNELEERLKKEENRKEVSLASFRKALEGKSSITQRQEQEIEASQKAAQQAERPRRASGEPEFEMLDSMKGNEEVQKSIAGNIGEAAAKNEGESDSILQRLRRLSGEDN